MYRKGEVDYAQEDLLLEKEASLDTDYVHSKYKVDSL